jgi:phosphoribosylglycinamide formyltransferase-1
MAAIIRACQSGELPASVDVVIAPKEDIGAVETARSLRVPVSIVPPEVEDYAEELLASLKGCDVVCLAGYLRLLPETVLRAFPGRILNVHPALLPKFGGKGMYGMKVHEAVLEAGEKESGATIHLVDGHYDEGDILLQRRCPVLPDDTPETLAARVLVEEHKAYVEAIRRVLA